RFLTAGAAGGLLVILAYSPLLDRIAGTFAMGHHQLRLHIWSVGLKAYGENPVFGLGPRRLPDYMAPYKASGYTDVASHAHNVYINAAAEEGTVGLLLMLFIFGYFLRKYFRAARAETDPLRLVYAAGLFAALVNLSISGVFESHFYTFITWSLMTFLMGLYEASGRKTAELSP
ncbi:MAG TPA: O-antigen ligase family protein, partial [Elusimicrobiales bacterium]|nr:O-antigen ligase family protein [Elusimicrobiales bacterium]